MTIKKLIDQSSDFQTFAKGYGRYLAQLLENLDYARLESFMKSLDEARHAGRTIFFAGNGGSAATALHMVNDFGTDMMKHAGITVPFRAVALTDNPAVMLAVANDDGYENIFIKQLKVLFKPGDVFVGISASGNSPNVVIAAEWVKAQKGKVLAFVGFDGGRLNALADVAVLVQTPKGEFGPVEDIHMVLDHLMVTWLQNALKQR